MSLSFCRSCEAEIRWVSTRNGKSMPLDPEPHRDGNVLVETCDDAPDVASVLVGRPRDQAVRSGVPLYRTHFVTCPNAARHRGGG